MKLFFVQARFVQLAVQAKTEWGDRLLHLMHSDGYWAPTHVGSTKEAVSLIRKEMPYKVSAQRALS
jgi:hypothetical protein